MLENKKILIAAGGTGGHINPALGTAGYIKEQNPTAQIAFVGTADKMEAKLVPQAGYELKTIEISGFWRSFSPEAIKHNIGTVKKLLKSSSQIKKIIKEFKPDLVIGFGGYVSGPVLRVAAKMGIPTAIHEQNAYPGITNKTLAKQVDRVMLTAAEAEKYLAAKNPVLVTGLPVRGEMLRADRDISRSELGIKDSQKLVLSMGGSLGAATINNAMVDIIADNVKREDLYFLHATGQYGLWVPDKLREKGVDPDGTANLEIREYINDMHRCMAAADIVICRAGASTLSELQAMGKASILIPSPNVAENHQYHNAMALVNKNAALILEEKEFTKEKMQELFACLADNDAERKSIEAAAKAMSTDDAKQKIADCIVSLIKA